MILFDQRNLSALNVNKQKHNLFDLDKQLICTFGLFQCTCQPLCKINRKHLTKFDNTGSEGVNLSRYMFERPL